MDKKKRIVKCVIDEQGRLGITAMGLVSTPAIEENWIALSKLKMSEVKEERRMLYGPALIPDKHILRVDKNTQEEYYIVFEKQTIYNAAHRFLKNNLHHNHTFEHQFPITGATVVETWIVESEQDKSRHLGFDLPAGTWMVGVYIEDDELWGEVKNGTIKGFSIEGMFNEVGLSLSLGDQLNQKNIYGEMFNEVEKYLHSLCL
jgi:hypothetical protein